MATLTGKLVADTYKALLKMIDNDVVTATEKQISDGLGGGTGIFIDQDGEIRASKYRVTAGTSSQFLKADGSLDSTSYLPSGTTTTSIPEGSNLYFTNSRVLNTTLNGFTAISGTVTSADSVLTAIEKIWWNIVNGGGGGGGGYVPYVGATQNLNLGEYGLLGGFVRFDTTPTTLAGTQGELFWDEDHSTIAIQMNSAKCVIGQDVYFYVKNQSGSTIPKGTAVGFAGTLGASGRLLIAPFLADGSQPSKYFMGLVAEDIADGDDGFVLEFGQIRQINTNAYNDGDILYVSPTVAGGLTTTIPEAPNNIITIAAVVHSASNGVLQVRLTLGSRLNEDELVYLDNLADKDALFYNNTTGRFENRDIYGTEGYLPIYDDIDILKDSIIYSDGVGIGVGTNILEPTAIATFFGNIDLVTGTYLTSDGFNLIGRGNLINQIEIGSQNASDYLTFIAGNAERARITAAGNFGIGLTNPSAPLHVKGSTYTNVIVDNNSATGGGSYLSYQNGTKKALFGLSGAFELNTGSDVAIASTIAGGGIKFYTNNSTTQAMGIVSSGNAYLGQAPTFLGLGTEFIVRGQASDGVLGVMDSTEAVKGLFVSNSSLSWLGTYSNHPLAFRTNNTEWARISSAGNLLIGTIVDNATDKLQVNGTSYFADNIVLADSKGIVSSGVNMLSRNNLNNQIIIGADGGINDNVAFYSGDLERMRLLANGRLAINKTTASYQVDVQGDVNVSGAFRVNGTIIPNGTVTSVAMSVPTGLVISGSPITSSGTLAVTYAVNYGIPTLTKQSDWDDAYTWVTNFPDQLGNSGKFLTTNGSVLSWASLVTGVSSVFGRTGAVTAQSGDYTTAQVTESGNLYYTDARARLALSGGTGITYNNTTGVIAYSGTVYTDSSIRALFSAGAGISYNNTTGVITSTITQYTDAMARASLSFVAGSGAYNSTTGVITIPTNTNQLTNGASFITLASLSASAPLSYNNGTGAFSISQASGSTNGFLSSTDWNTFNNKQNALGYTPVPTTRTLTINGTSYDLSADRSWTISTGIGGSGTTNYLPKFTNSTTLGDSIISQGGAGIYIAGTDNFTNANGGWFFSGSGSYSTGIFAYNTSNNLRLVAPTQIEFNLGATEAMRITSAGNVGIGTSSPSNILTIKNNSSGTNGIDFQSYAYPSMLGSIFYEQTNDTFNIVNASAYSGSAIVFKTNNAEKARIDKSGNLGLGVTPSAWVSSARVIDIGAYSSFFQDSDGYPQMSFNSYESASNVYRYKLNDLSTRYRQWNGQHQWFIAPSGTAGNTISFTQAMTLDASGNLGLGTSSPSGYGSGYPTIDLRGSTGSGIKIGNATDVALLYANSTATYLRTSSYKPLIFGTFDSERVRISEAGNVLIGTTTDSGYKLRVNGSGYFDGNMFFGAGGDAEITLTGFNGGIAKLSNNSGYNANYNGLVIYSNYVNANSLPSWAMDLGGNNGQGTAIVDSYRLLRKPSGGSYSTLLSIASTGAAIFSSSITAASAQFSQSAGTSLGVYQTAATNSTTAVIRQTGAGGNGNQDIGLVVDIQGATDADRIANFRYYDGTNYNSRMVVTRGGSVGIGTTSPSNGLLVINSTSATGVRFALESSGTMNGIVALGNNAISGLSTTDMALWTRGVMAFETGASGEKMRITSQGRLLLGTTSSGSLMFEFSDGANTNKYTTLAGNLRAVGRITDDLTNVRGIGFGYSSAENLGFIYGTSNGTNTSKLAFLIFNGSTWQTNMTLKTGGTTLNIGGIPSSNAGLVSGDVYKDANGFLKIV